MQALIDLVRLHGTKFLGFLGSTLGVLAVADPALVGGPQAIKYYLLGISLLTTWRGFFTSDAFKVGLVVKAENAAKADAIIKDQKQGGRTLLEFLGVLLALGVILTGVAIGGCISTQAAYKAAPLHGEALADTAYVIAEHYSAVLHEAANLRESGRVPAPLVLAMQKADAAAKPLIIGEPEVKRPGLKQIADAYTAVHDAKTEADLQAAVNNAVRALGDLMRSVNAAKGK